MRHASAVIRENDPQPGVSVATLAREYPPDSCVGQHAHGADQLVYASRGVMQVSSDRSVWLIPPQFAIWVPAHTVHEIHMPDSVSMRTLYFRRGIVSLPGVCRVLHITPLLREIVLEVVRRGRLRARGRFDSALREVLVHQIVHASPVPVETSLPQDRRALAVARAAMERVSAADSLASLCRCAGLSVRTLERIFQRETGASFETWRRHVRLMKSVELLVSGASVKEAAFLVGYQQPNPLVLLFRKTFGQTPKAWIAALN